MAIVFCKIAEPYGCFSNFSKHPLYVGGVWYKTSEHYYQTQKFEDTETRQRIIDANTPKEAANLGRTLPMNKERWEQIKLLVMYSTLIKKTTQHKDVLDTLMSTGNEEIIEHNFRDDFWADGPDGTGKNMLGKTWMEVRDNIKNGKIFLTK